MSTSDMTVALERVDFLPPDRVTDDVSILTLKSLVLEPLCTWRRGTAAPGLFSAWEHDTQGRVWTFSLRPKASFHDGAPCTAPDVLDFIAAIRTALDMFGMRWSYARYFEGCLFEAPDARTVRVRTPRPFGDLPDVFSDFHLTRRDAQGRPILGTGPYRVAAFEPGVAAVLERVTPDGGPRRLIFDAVADPEHRLARVRDGGADVATNLERCAGRLDFGADLQWGKQLCTLSIIAYLNGLEGLFRDPRARLAVNQAVDKRAITEGVYEGLAQAASTVASPFHLGFKSASVAPIAYDPEAARRRLDGVEVPGELVLRTPTHMPERSVQVSEVIAASLGAIGLTVRVEIEPDRPRYARQIGEKQMGDLALFDSSPHSTFRVLDDKISSAAKGVWWQGHDDADLQTLIARANTALDPLKREAAYGQCLRRLNANPAWLYLAHPVQVIATRKGIAPPRLDAKGMVRF